MAGSDCEGPAALTFPPKDLYGTSWLLLPAAIFQFVIIAVARYDALLPTTSLLFSFEHAINSLLLSLRLLNYL